MKIELDVPECECGCGKPVAIRFLKYAEPVATHSHRVYFRNQVIKEAKRLADANRCAKDCQ